MTLPASVSVLDVGYVLSIAGVAVVTGNVLGAGLSLLVATAYFVASAVIADRRSEPVQ